MNNKEKYSLKNKDYYKNNKKILTEEQRVKRQIYSAIYYNKEENKEKRRVKNKYIRNTNVHRKLQSNVSRSIRQSLNRSNNKKNGSYKNKLSYTIFELKQYLEKLFEPWMTWNNYGSYNKKSWKDNDQSTWIWNIDHIIPQSDIPYTCMDDINFKKCWALENLRPYSAKLNLLDGSNRTRHMKLK